MNNLLKICLLGSLAFPIGVKSCKMERCVSIFCSNVHVGAFGKQQANNRQVTIFTCRVKREFPPHLIF